MQLPGTELCFDSKMLFVKKRTSNAYIVLEFLIFSFKRTNVVVHLLLAIKMTKLVAMSVKVLFNKNSTFMRVSEVYVEPRLLVINYFCKKAIIDFRLRF